MRVARVPIVDAGNRAPPAWRANKSHITCARWGRGLGLTVAAFLLGVQPIEAQPPGLTGQIVYAIVDEGDSKVYLVSPDGTPVPSTLIWTGARPLPIFPSVGWRPDGGEITLKSAHEYACSRWDSDLYGLALDGSSIRRITNSPDCATLASFPQGSVQVTVEQPSGVVEIYGVWIDGAQSHVDVLLAGASSKTVTIPNVADLGPGREQSVWIKAPNGTYVYPSSYADVLPSQTVIVADNPVITEGFGPFNLSIESFSWSGDGSAIATGLAAGVRYIVPAEPTEPFQTSGTPFPAPGWNVSGLAWAPVSDEFLYYSSTHPTQPGVYLAARGSDGGEHVFVFNPTDNAHITSLAWLPDETGFLYSLTRFGLGDNEIGYYDFATGNYPLYYGPQGFGGASPSPDGNYFAWGNCIDGTCDLIGHSLFTEEPDWTIVATDSSTISWSWGVVCDSVPLDLSDPTPITGPWLEVDCLRIDAGPLVAASGSSGTLSAPTVALRNGVEIGTDATLVVKN